MENIGRELLRFIKDGPNLATKQDVEGLEATISTLATREYVEKVVGNLAWKVAGFLVAQAAVIVTLIKSSYSKPFLSIIFKQLLYFLIGNSILFTFIINGKQ